MQTNGYHTFQIQLGARLQACRKRRGLTQEQAGEAIGIDRVSVGYIEQGRRSPKLSTLYALVNLYDTSFEGLFAEDEGSV